MSFGARIHQARFPQPSSLRANGSIATGLNRATELVGGSILWFSCAVFPSGQSAQNLRLIARPKSIRQRLHDGHKRILFCVGQAEVHDFAHGHVIGRLRCGLARRALTIFSRLD